MLITILLFLWKSVYNIKMKIPIVNEQDEIIEYKERKDYLNEN